MKQIKNILIPLALVAVLILGYIFFIKKAPDASTLTSNITTSTSVTDAGSLPITQEFVTLLLNVKNIKLDDSIFRDPAFAILTDSSISLVPDGTQGRPNPFAPVGADTSTTTPASNVSNNPTTPSTNPATIIPPTGTIAPATLLPSNTPTNTGTTTTPTKVIAPGATTTSPGAH